MSTLPPCAPCVNPASPDYDDRIMTDGEVRELRNRMLGLPPGASVTDAVLAAFDRPRRTSAAVIEPRPEWRGDVFEPTADQFAERLGFELGADGVPAGLLTPHEDERRAFEAGHNAGDDHLWRVDPLFAAHLRERADRALQTGTWTV